MSESEGAALTVVDRRAASAPAGPSVLYREEGPVSRETLAHWQQMLEAAIPVTEHLSHFRVEWEPGDPWRPAQRWVVWQMQPVTRPDGSLAIHPELWAGLHGPHPRSQGHPCFVGWCGCDLKRNRWVDGPPSVVPGIDRRTYELFHQNGRKWMPYRFWVVQGPDGGHRWSLTDQEEKFAQFAMGGGRPITIPRIGALPYAPFDGRVVQRIAAYDKLASWKFARDFAARTGADVAADDAQVAEAAVTLLEQHLGEQTALWLDEHGKPWLTWVRENAIDPTKEVRPYDEDRVTQQFRSTMTGV
jgi:hypothetical protein